jgi:hypothetical protein
MRRTNECVSLSRFALDVSNRVHGRLLSELQQMQISGCATRAKLFTDAVDRDD